MCKDRTQDCLSHIIHLKVYVIRVKQLFSIYSTISYIYSELINDCQLQAFENHESGL